MGRFNALQFRVKEFTEMYLYTFNSWEYFYFDPLTKEQTVTVYWHFNDITNSSIHETGQKRTTKHILYPRKYRGVTLLMTENNLNDEHYGTLKMTMYQSTFKNNELLEGQGAVMHLMPGCYKITHCIFTKNVAGRHGGVIAANRAVKLYSYDFIHV